MTRYEELIHKINLLKKACRNCLLHQHWDMADMWHGKAIALEYEMTNMTVIEAMEEV